MNVKEQILKDRGLLETQPAKKRHRRLIISPLTSVDKLKTSYMRYKELEYGKPIEKMLMAGSLSVVAKKLGLDPSTVSKWKKRLRLIQSNELPICEGCKCKSKLCEMGICQILVDSGEEILLLRKQKEITNES